VLQGAPDMSFVGAAGADRHPHISGAFIAMVLHVL